MSRRIGPHALQIDGDLVTVHLVGEVSLDEMKGITAELEGVIAAHGRFGVLADVRELRSLSPAARRYAGSWKQVMSSYGSAAFGASLPIRTIVSLLSHAMELFMKRTHRGRLDFFKTEEEARAWLLKQREEMLSR